MRFAINFFQMLRGLLEKLKRNFLKRLLHAVLVMLHFEVLENKKPTGGKNNFATALSTMITTLLYDYNLFLKFYNV